MVKIHEMLFKTPVRSVVLNRSDFKTDLDKLAGLILFDRTHFVLNRWPIRTNDPSAAADGHDKLIGLSTNDPPARAGGDNKINELSTIHTTRRGGWC